MTYDKQCEIARIVKTAMDEGYRKAIDDFICRSEVKYLYPHTPQWLDYVWGTRGEEYTIHYTLKGEAISGVVILERHTLPLKIAALVVGRQYRGQGIGTALMAFAKGQLGEDATIQVPMSLLAVYTRLWEKVSEGAR